MLSQIGFYSTKGYDDMAMRFSIWRRRIEKSGMNVKMNVFMDKEVIEASMDQWDTDWP